MCGRFIVVPRNVVEDIIQEVEANRAVNYMPDWPATNRSVYPKAEVPLILSQENHLACEVMKWGYEVTWNKGVIFNTRADTALKPGRNMWASSLANRRCIVPTFGFYEPHKTETFIDPATGKSRKQQYVFTNPASPILFIAGIFDKGQFSLMTTEPTRSMSPIHDRMPVVLGQSELNTWLTGDYLSLFDRRKVALDIDKVSQ